MTGFVPPSDCVIINFRFMPKKSVEKIAEYHLNLNQPRKLQFALHELGSYLQEHGENASKPHIHSFYQIIWFKKGKGKHFVDFKEYDVSDNAIFFIAKNQVHYFDHSSDYSGILIHFNETFLVQDNTEMELFLKFNLFNNPYQQPSCCVGSGINGKLDEYILMMKDELAATGAFAQEELLRSYLKAFLIQVQRRKSEFDASSPPGMQVDEKRMQLLRFINLVEENYKKGFAVADFAKMMHVSTRTLSDLTMQLTGKSPSAIIQERIVLEAQRMLLHSGNNINQIAFRLGFDDPSYFVKYFKKHTGLSPSEFRKSIS